MSQTSAAMRQTPNTMKKKVIAALIAVVVAHMGVLFAVGHLKSPELKKIEKAPLKVRFVKITEDAPPPPPPPAEPIKPKVQPKPEPKVVEPAPVIKPKVITAKPEPQVEKIKPIVVDDSLEKQKREQERLDQLRINQERADQQKRDQAQRDQQAQREQQARDQQAREESERRAQEARNTPRNLSQGQISWVRSPKPSYTNIDLKGSDRTIVVAIEADTNGQITNVRVVRSSGVDALDQKILRAVRGAKFKPYKEKGVAYPFKAEQPFELKLNSNG